MPPTQHHRKDPPREVRHGFNKCCPPIYIFQKELGIYQKKFASVDLLS